LDTKSQIKSITERMVALEAKLGVAATAAPRVSGPSEIAGFSIVEGDTQGLSDTAGFVTLLSSLASGETRVAGVDPTEIRAANKLFDFGRELFVARAPGRMDVMGGIADYSGSAVLQMPISEACHTAVQKSSTGKLRIVSLDCGKDRLPNFEIPLSSLTTSDGSPISYDQANALFKANKSTSWAAYVAGTLLVLAREKGLKLDEVAGLDILLRSGVPEGKGVSSSASVEVATMSAVAPAVGIAFTGEGGPREMAILCQKVENLVVGAPCGVMDQMASTCGAQGALMSMVCRPAELRGVVAIPGHVQVWGIDSGIQHSVGGADYGSVRVGAFMGKAIINASTAAAPTSCLATITPNAFDGGYNAMLPISITGGEFLDKYKTHGDTVTEVDRSSTYSVRAASKHPVYEHFRVETYGQLLMCPPHTTQLEMLGELMYQSHQSYSDCGLGSAGTDKLVAMVKEEQAKRGGVVYGAKITGGGSGGTVCILGDNSKAAEEAVRDIAARYAVETGHTPYVFSGSSPGAASFGFLRVQRR
jgi:L-arabinokinase